MSWLPDDIREASGGEHVDRLARDAINLAHQALDRFPDVVRRHKYVAGGAAISTSLVVIAGVAVARRMRKGQTAEEAVASLTEDELLHPVYDDDADGTPGAPEEPAATAASANGPDETPSPAEERERLERTVHLNGTIGPATDREGSETH